MLGNVLSLSLARLYDSTGSYDISVGRDVGVGNTL